MQKVIVAALAVAAIAMAGIANASVPANTITPGQPVNPPGTIYQGPLVASETATFPVASDSWHVSSYPWWWQTGDNVVGTRSMSITSINEADVHLVVYNNSLSNPGEVDLQLMINTNVVGSFVLVPGQTVADVTLNFPTITVSEPLTLEYYETNTVYSGAGSLWLDDTGQSTVVLNGGATPTQPSTWGEVKGLYR